MNDFLKGRKLIVCHRGMTGGNIIQNTAGSAKLAVLNGADVVEFDVASCLDGEIFIFHGGMERMLFSTSFPFELCTSGMIKKRELINISHGRSKQYLYTLDEYLEEVKPLNCMFNLDRIWKADVKTVLEKVKAHGMLERIIIKTESGMQNDSIMKAVAEYPEIFYMGISFSPEEFKLLESKCVKFNLNMRGVEVIFKKDSDYFASPEFFDYCKEKGYLTWVNAITLNGRPDMCAGHGDYASVIGGLEGGYGWLLERQYDFIQTDYPALLSSYMKTKGLR